MPVPERVSGPYFGEFAPEQEIVHPRSIEVTRKLFTELVDKLCFADQRIHVDQAYARSQGYADVILPGPIVYTLVFQLTRREISWSGLNSQTEMLRHPSAVYPEDTLFAKSVILGIGEWHGRRGKTHGLINVKTTGFNQQDVIILEFERTVLIPYRISKS